MLLATFYLWFIVEVVEIITCSFRKKTVQLKVSMYYCIVNYIISLYDKLLCVDVFNDVVYDKLTKQISRKNFYGEQFKRSNFLSSNLNCSQKNGLNYLLRQVNYSNYHKSLKTSKSVENECLTNVYHTVGVFT